MENFEFIYGSVVGRDHSQAGRNNQDGYCVHNYDDHLIAVICDGCGSGSHSDVGAKIAARIISFHLHSFLCMGLQIEQALSLSRQKTISAIMNLAEEMDGVNVRYILDSYFLFTVLVAVITKNKGTGIFAIGDGTYAVNGTINKIDPFPGNAPPYLMYAMLFPEVSKATEFVQLHLVPDSEKISSIMITTDGIDYFDVNKPIPGKIETFGPLSQFWEDDKYYKNSDMLRRRLFMLTRDRQGIASHMHDDVTVIALRLTKNG